MSDAIPPSFRYFITGRSGSGKTSRLLADVLSKVPRVLLVDQTGEWYDRRPGNGAMDRTEAFDLGETLAALRRVSHLRRWWLVASLDPEEVEQLRQALMPAGRLRQGPAVQLGGLTLCLDEVDRVIGTGPSPLRDLWRRGRHAGISVAAATQRIGNVSKEVTSQCDTIGIMAVHDPGDQDYLRSLMGAELASEALEWANARPFNIAYFNPAGGRLDKAEGAAP